MHGYNKSLSSSAISRVDHRTRFSYDLAAIQLCVKTALLEGKKIPMNCILSHPTNTRSINFHDPNLRQTSWLPSACYIFTNLRPSMCTPKVALQTLRERSRSRCSNANLRQKARNLGQKTSKNEFVRRKWSLFMVVPLLVVCCRTDYLLPLASSLRSVNSYHLIFPDHALSH